MKTDYFASCPKGIENLLSDELAELGCENLRQTIAGVSFSAPLKTLYKVLLWTRLANRILMPLARDKAKTSDEIYNLVYQIPWDDYMLPSATILVDFVGSNDDITNTQFGAQRVKDAVVDRFVGLGMARPSVSKIAPDVRINARLTKSSLILSIDMSGDSLHRRGYRTKQGAAPLKENLAAAVLVRAGWPRLLEKARQEKKQIALADPMCGSGTFLIEAAMMAANMAPGLKREVFGCERLRTHDKELWQSVKQEAEAEILPLDDAMFPIIQGGDIDEYMLRISRENISETPFGNCIRLKHSALEHFTAPSSEGGGDLEGLLICNPPYGERLGEAEDLRVVYQTLGQVAKENLSGWQIGVFTSNVELAREMRLRAKNKYKFFNGKLPTELHLFDILGGEAKLREDRDVQTTPLSDGAEMVFNRLKKNRKRLDRWIKKENIECYRLYDADMPEYSAAIDVYGDQFHIQEYKAPKTINENNAQVRFNEICHATVKAFDLQPDQVISKTRMRQKGRAQYQKLGELDQKHFLEIQEGGAKLRVNLHDYIDTGLFLDHRPLRKRIRAEASGKQFLNLFCYTATATVQAVLGGAAGSVSVDLSNTYLDWAKNNFALNNISTARHSLVRADCIKWLNDCRQGFDIIMLDPPSFSNSKSTTTILDIQKDHAQLIQRCMDILNPGGVLYFSVNLRSFKLDESLVGHFHVDNISKETLDPDFERNPKIHSCWAIKNQ